MSKRPDGQNIWDINWAQLQQQYLEALDSFTRTMASSGAKPTPGTEWNKAMEYWWKNTLPGLPGEHINFYSKLLDQTKSFYFLGDQLAQILNMIPKVDTGSDEWINKFSEQIEIMKQACMAPDSLGQGAMLDALGKFQSQTDTWMSMFRAIPGFSHEMANVMQPDEIHKVIEQYLTVPSVGYSRELQEKIQNNLVLWKKHQQSSHEYNRAMARVGTEALDHLRDKIIEMAKRGEEITSLRQLYDLWVDCNEHTYAKFVYGEEHSELYGNMVNDLMAFRNQSSEIMNEYLMMLNMPTKKDIEALQKHQHEFQRKVGEAHIQHMDDKKRIHNLEKELGQMRSLIESKGLVSKKKTKSTVTKTAKKKTKKKRTTRQSSEDKGKVVNIKSAGKGKKTKSKANSKSKKGVIEIKF